MNILPKFLYLFQSIPLAPPSNFFDKMKKLFCNFIWNDRRSRMRMNLLYLPYDRGGLKLPFLQAYYWAAQLRAASYWFDHHPSLHWIKMEETTTSKIPLYLYIYSADLATLKKHTRNPFVRNTLTVWHEVLNYLGENAPLSQFSPIWGNKNFTPGTKDLGFKLWADRGISRIIDLYENDTLLSFPEIKQRFDIEPKHFFKYLQIRSFITETQNSLNPPSLNTLERTVLTQYGAAGLISKFYQIILNATKESSEDKRLAWCSDLNEDITVEEWKDICFQCHVQTINTRFKLLQYKWLMRIYFTPELLHRIYPNTPDTCVKCGLHKGSLFHCLWECTLIQAFWKEVVAIISICIKERLPLCPKLCIFGCFPANSTLSNSRKRMVIFCLLEAKHKIAVSWKSIHRPSKQSWIEGLLQSLALEKLTYAVKGKYNTFIKIWGSFLGCLLTTWGIHEIYMTRDACEIFVFFTFFFFLMGT